MRILTTSNYSLFKIMKGNRVTKDVHVRRIAKSMLAVGQESPIKVNGKMEIIDGQHRFAAAKSINIPISYYIVAGSDIGDVLICNTISKKWGNEDFLNMYCEGGKEAYLQLKQLKDKYKVFSIPILCSILSLKSQAVRTEKDGIISYDFKEGNLCIVDILKSEDLISKLLDFEDYVRVSNTVFVRAFIGIWNHEKYSHERMLQKLTMCGKRLKGCNSITEFKDGLIEVYNFRSKDRIDFAS